MELGSLQPAVNAQAAKLAEEARQVVSLAGKAARLRRSRARTPEKVDPWIETGRGLHSRRRHTNL